MIGDTKYRKDDNNNQHDEDTHGTVDHSHTFYHKYWGCVAQVLYIHKHWLCILPLTICCLQVCAMGPDSLTKFEAQVMAWLHRAAVAASNMSLFGQNWLSA